MQLLIFISSGAIAKRPNILFILTDDQDGHMESVEHMPYLQSEIVSKGVTFDRHFCTVALCCPSRATLWTGKAAHNHNVTDVYPPHGGYPKVVDRGINDDYLPIWLQEAGYNTYYAGKLWNFHSVSNYDAPHARGFNGSDFLLDPYTYQYWNSKITHNGEPPVSYAGQYSTDVIADKSFALLREALSHPDDPWFLTVAPIAPHSNWVHDAKQNITSLSAPQVAYRHEHLFHDYQIPRNASFNKPIRGGASWVGRLTELNDSVVAYNDFFQRQRLRALQSVDEMLHELVRLLEEAGELDNTYIFYSTDNGYHISQHAMHPGKECGLDTDIHIPLFVRGPGLEAGEHRNLVTSHTDIAPTLLQIAGATQRINALDGEPIALTANALPHDGGRSEHVAVEFWGLGIPEGHYGLRSDNNREAGNPRNVYTNNTYRGLRIVADEYSLYYSVWCNGDRELYDLKHDPYQTVNLLVEDAIVETINMGSSTRLGEFQVAGRDYKSVAARLDALVLVLRDCKAEVCRRPWKTLHPDGSVSSLAAALHADFDNFYYEQPKMAFDGCGGGSGYLKELETAAHVHPYERESELGGASGKSEHFEYGNEWLLAV